MLRRLWRRLHQPARCQPGRAVIRRRSEVHRRRATGMPSAKRRVVHARRPVSRTTNGRRLAQQPARVRASAGVRLPSPDGRQRMQRRRLLPPQRLPLQRMQLQLGVGHKGESREHRGGAPRWRQLHGASLQVPPPQRLRLHRPVGRRPIAPRQVARRPEGVTATWVHRCTSSRSISPVACRRRMLPRSACPAILAMVGRRGRSAWPTMSFASFGSASRNCSTACATFLRSSAHRGSGS